MSHYNPQVSTRSGAIAAHHEQTEATQRSYTIGFISSIALTLVAYVLVTHHVFTAHVDAGIIIGLALIQFVVQMLFFLHLGAETKPRWKLLAALFMVMVVLILVLGSLWIMDNLNYHTMTPAQERTYLKNNEGL